MTALHLDTDFFRKHASASEDGLLNTVAKLAVDKDTTSVLNFAKVLAELGTTGPLFDQGEDRDLKNPKIGAATFTLAIALALAPLDGRKFQRNALSDEQAEIFSLVLETIDKHPARNELLAKFAFELTGTARDPKVFEKLAAMGVDLTAVHKTRAVDVYKTVNVTLEALAHGNTVAAIAFLPSLKDESIAELIDELEEGVKDNHSVLFLGSKGLLRATKDLVTMQAHGGLLDLLSAMDDRVGAEAMGGVRARLIAFHLERCIAKSTPWDADQVRALTGPGGFDPEQSMMTRKLINASPSWEPNAYKGLIEASLRSHCAPTLELCHPVVSSLVHDGRNRLTIGKAIEQGNYSGMMRDCKSDDYPCIVERFKATLKVMTDYGHDHEEAATVNGKFTPSMHYLARTERKDRAQKQIGLLELGLSPKLKDDRGWVALSHVKGEESKSQWVSVERSFLARNKAHNVLAELDLDSGPKP